MQLLWATWLPGRIATKCSSEDIAECVQIFGIGNAHLKPCAIEFLDKPKMCSWNNWLMMRNGCENDAESIERII